MKEKYLWSFDISTTNIGISLWGLDGKLIELKHLALKTSKDVPTEHRDIYKTVIFKEYILENKKRIESELNGEIVDFVVEEPLGGSNNPTTQSLLFGFNGMCRYILFDIFGVYPSKISVYDSRKIFCPELVTVKYNKSGEKKETLSFPAAYKNKKKEYIWEKVSKLEPKIEWYYKKDSKEPKDICFDMSDSYCVGYSYLKQKYRI